MNKSKARDILNSIKNKKIIVLGDIMLDEYIFGNVDRISPEAPVPIINVSKEHSTLGGAANVAANLKALGAEPVLIGVYNNDTAGNKIVSLLKSKMIDTSGLVEDSSRPTITKTRVIGHQQQMIRLDRELVGTLDKSVLIDIKHKIDTHIKDVCALIVSDYAKNVIDSRLMNYVKVLCKDLNIPWFVDPKPIHYHLYSGATIITPNIKELEGLSDIKINSDTDINIAGNKLISDLSLTSILITRSERGMTLISSDELWPWTIPTKAREVYDVSGAGDTVIAVLGAAVGSGCSLQDSVSLANITAGIVVGKLGTATTNMEEILDYLEA